MRTEESDRIPAADIPDGKGDLARRVRRMRNDSRLTLQQLSQRSGLSVSALSKIENAQLSPTYDSLIKLAKGLRVDVARLFADEQKPVATARLSITRQGEGVQLATANYDYRMLCTELARKKLQPLTARIKAGTRRTFGPLIAHEGEEVVFVVSGSVELHTEHYRPIVLEPGDCAFFDSSMPHGFVALGGSDAEIFWVCSDQRQEPPSAGIEASEGRET